MRKYYIFLIILIFSCQDNLQSPEIIFETKPQISQIGLPVNHIIRVSNIGELFTINDVAWQDSSYWLQDSSRVIITESSIDSFDNYLLLNYEITFWDTGKVIIPPNVISLSFPDSLAPVVLKTDSSEVFIASVFDSTMTTVINDKPLKEIQFPIERLRLFAFFLLIFAIIYFLSIVQSRNIQEVNQRKFFNSNPKLKALKDVEKINLDLPVEEFYNKIAGILKKYFQNNFYIISFEMTSFELKKYFNDNDLNVLLNEIDQVKFAKKEPSKSEKKDILELLKKVIRKLL
tara:strand:+ start:60 stop:923 length:864 start_codon:yes stop_codon:yes gene_type:complete